jgi:putative transcriptional regulator
MGTIRLRLREVIAQREARDNRRMPHDEIARETGVDAETIAAMMENRASDVSLDALARLCDHLTCAPADLLDYSRGEAASEDMVDVRDIVDSWEQQYGADEHPRH